MNSHPNDRLRRVRAAYHPHDWFRVNRNRSPMRKKGGRRTQRWLKRTRSGVVGLVAVAVIAGLQVASAAPKHKVDVFEVATGEPITGAFSMLDRTDDGMTTKLRTRSIPGHAYTLWYVIFNAPENCSDGVCGEDDIFVDPTDHSAGFNEAQIVAARVSVVWGSDGAVANPAGRVNLDGGLVVGAVPDGSNQVVLGRGEDGAIFGLGVVTGLEDAHGAEIHIVVEDHGTAHDDPELLAMQLTSFGGACNPECEDSQVAVHGP